MCGPCITISAVLDEYQLQPPRTLDELDAVAQRIVPPGTPQPIARYGFLPDPRRIWAWGIVFGGRFVDPASGEITSDSEPIVRACDWMASYGRRYGFEEVTRFRKGDQALPGAAFPLLEQRYALVMDGQWRVAEITAAAQRPTARRARAADRRRAAAAAAWWNGKRRLGERQFFCRAPRRPQSGRRLGIHEILERRRRP